MYKFLFLALIVICSHASVIKLDYANVKFENFNISYFMDKNSSMTINKILNIKFDSIKNSHGLYGQRGNSWYKIDFKNTTANQKEIFLHHDLAYFHKQIEIYEIHNGEMRDQHIYNVLEEKDSNKLLGSSIVHKININSHDSLTVYIKNIPMVSNLFNLNIYDKYTSQKALMSKDFYSILIVSIMITLALYNGTLYFFNKRKEFLYYALYMMTPAIGLNYKYGTIFSQFELYGEGSYWLNLTAILMPAFLILFIKQVLDTKNLNKRVNFLLNALLSLISIDVFVAIFIDLTLAMELFNILFIITTVIIIYLIVYLTRTSHPLATIFTLAYSFYFSGILLTICAMAGGVDLNFFTFRSGGIGLIFEGLIFSYLMHYNIKILEKEISDQREVIIVKNKKAQLGDMISAITHQWKQPLTRISSVNSLMEFHLENNNKISDKEIKNHIKQVNNDINFLSETIDDFRNFFNSNQEKTNCDMNILINKVIQLSNDDTLNKEVTISTELSFKSDMLLYQNELLHILLNIIQNAKEAFTNQEIKLIKIIGYTKNAHHYIDIIDNAGGISEENMPFIFDEYYTTKKEKVGSGLGLYLSKIILKDRLKGDIIVKNIPNGTMFRIVL